MRAAHDDSLAVNTAAVQHDSFLVTCSSRQLLSRLADKWVTLVLCALMDGRARHSVLARRITGVSQKMLTQTLRNLERDGLVERTVTPTVPLTVEYELTTLGASLVNVFLQLKNWADENMDDVARAREDFDARVAHGVAGAGN
ncbi:transcriptional regulator [Rhodococcus sp. 06-412-2C]|uniref:winged helix-turn-helix transcriptional regulator n=1 Tax=unclassified Rhodococcus (in: high G+C Gram-positive bacteria) TaxID=192944 RepID=UPI000B9B9877|nr:MULTISPECIES: helix-turn-helix domain-containing protein [unclassified Rhodococcus (in: high G+C Gram-positive bacteria)]OZC83624.1 transcriptional regulator [Rhodococcus sp. 06-412-2C]OZC93809.1 transcriptional regulator [Rhodococcus sp. 06-412-2B]